MIPLANGLSWLDLELAGVPRVVATVVIHGPGGVALVDPGPSSTLPVLRARLAEGGIALDDVDALLLTHIHLDHGGACGTLVREHPRMRVYVHEKGAPHLVDPAKVLASATRLFGDAMDRLWGEVRPVPPDALVVLKGGERVREGGRDLDVAWTPGHATHHVSYFSPDTGVAFVGDTAGTRVRPGATILPPTPPPDIDLEAWRHSIATINAWGADTLFLTHFGPSSPAAPHLSELVDALEKTASLVRDSLGREGSDADREAWYSDQVRRELRRTMTEADARACEVAGPLGLNWRGLARYWQKREIR